MEQNRVVAFLLAALEVAAALFVATVVTGVLSLPFALTRIAEFQIWPAEPAGRARLSAEELVERVVARDLALEVELRTADQEQWLVLTGVSSLAKLTETMTELLETAGYGSDEPLSRRTIDPGIVVRHRARSALAVQALVFLGLGLLLTRLRVRDVAGPRVNAWVSLAVGVGGGLAAFLGSALVALVLGLIGLPVQEQAWVAELLSDRANLLRLAPFIVLIVPLSEEVFFRGYVMPFVAQRAGTAAGVAMSSVLFAAVHFNLTGLPVYLTIGAVLAFVYLRTRALLAPIVAHMTHNALVLALSFLAPPTP